MTVTVKVAGKQRSTRCRLSGFDRLFFFKTANRHYKSSFTDCGANSLL